MCDYNLIIQKFLSAMKIGLNCYNEYKTECIKDPTTRLSIENEVNSAENFHTMLCHGNEYRRDYLRHTKCVQLSEKVKLILFL